MTQEDATPIIDTLIMISVTSFVRMASPILIGEQKKITPK
jgi:hypothetical protein